MRQINLWIGNLVHNIVFYHWYPFRDLHPTSWLRTPIEHLEKGRGGRPESNRLSADSQSAAYPFGFNHHKVMTWANPHTNPNNTPKIRISMVQVRPIPAPCVGRRNFGLALALPARFERATFALTGRRSTVELQENNCYRVRFPLTIRIMKISATTTNT
jgi:hypothetical protein